MTEAGRARLALAAVCLVWGTTYLAIRVAVKEVPPALFCAVRFLWAGAALLAYCLWRGDALPRGRDLGRIAVVAAVLLVLCNGLLAWAVQWVPTGIASMIIVTTPFWMVLLARLDGETVPPRALAGLVLGFLGLFLLLFPAIRAAKPGSGFAKGIGGLLLSSLCWSLGSEYSKKYPVGTTPLMSLAVQMLLGGALFALVGFWLGEAPLWRPGPNSWVAIAYLALFGSIIGYGSYLYALARLPTSQVVMYAYVNPLIAILLGTVFLGERLGAPAAMGAPMVLWGVYWINSSASASGG